MNQSVNELEKQFIAILDFGSQYSQLIARRVRENGVFSRIVPFNIRKDELAKMNPKGIILSGGPASVYGEGSPRCDRGLLELDIPILGICYGLQLMALIEGGEVSSAMKREYGKAHLIIDKEQGLFEGIGHEQVVWMSHGDHITRLQEGYEVIAHTDNAPYAAIGCLVFNSIQKLSIPNMVKK